MYEIPIDLFFFMIVIISVKDYRGDGLMALLGVEHSVNCIDLLG